MLYYALLTFVLCGVAGILIDLDHPIAYYVFRSKIPGRFLHKPTLILSIIAIGLVSSYIGGLLHW